MRAARVVWNIDVGDPSWRPLVFFGGLGTDVNAFYVARGRRDLRAVR
jgi:hypothetical protein